MSKQNVRTCKRANAAREIQNAVKFLQQAKAARRSAQKALDKLEQAITSLEAALVKGHHTELLPEHRVTGGKTKVLNGLASKLTRKIETRIANLKALRDEISSYPITAEEKALAAHRNGRQG